MATSIKVVLPVLILIVVCVCMVTSQRRGKFKDFTRVTWSVMISTSTGDVKVRQKGLYNEDQQKVVIITRGKRRKTGFSRSVIMYDFSSNNIYLRSRKRCGPANLGSTESFTDLVELIKSKEGKEFPLPEQTADVQAVPMTGTVDSDVTDVCTGRRNRSPAINQFSTFNPSASQTTKWKIIGLDKVYSIFA